jgi:hypothetical protein
VKYLVCIPCWNGAGNYDEYEGYDAEDAAKNAGQDYNEDGDYPLMDRSIFALVKESEDATPILISVSAEPDVHYSANECTRRIECNYCGKDMREAIIAGQEPFDERFCDRNCYLEHIDAYRREKGLEPLPKAKA